MKRDALTAHQAHALWVLKTSGPLSREQIKTRLQAIYGPDSFYTGIHAMVDELEDREFVEIDGPANKKNPNYSLTPDVKAALEGERASGRFSKHLNMVRKSSVRVLYIGHRPDELLESDRGEQQ